MLRAFLHNNLSSLHVFLHTNFLDAHCIFPALLHLNKQNVWRGWWTLWRKCRRGITEVHICTLISYSSVEYFSYCLCICCACSTALHFILFYNPVYICYVSFCLFSCELYSVCCYIEINRTLFISFTCLSSYKLAFTSILYLVLLPWKKQVGWTGRWILLCKSRGFCGTILEKVYQLC